MAVLNIEVLKEIVDKLPDDFSVEFEDGQGKVSPLSDDINIKVSKKKLVLSLY